jgi:hypothetical protein
VPTSDGRGGLIQQWQNEHGGNGARSKLGARPMAESGRYFQPDNDDVALACTFKGKVDEQAAAALRTGAFSTTTARLISKGIERQWAPKTVEVKYRYVLKFMAFLRATGRKESLLAEVEGGRNDEELVIRPERARATSSAEEEQTLCEFAVIRVMAGHTIDSVLGTISHLRTWFRNILVREFGKVGEKGRMSVTSQYLKSLEELFPPDTQQKDAKRQPLTWGIVQMMAEYAEQIRWRDPGVACAVAYAGLYRMGELTATETRPFDAVRDLAEHDVRFLPSFWNADRVEIQLGITKADRQGKLAKLRPRILPVDAGSPGMMLRDMLARRMGAKRGEQVALSGRPLFQARDGKQLARDSVLRFMRKAMKGAGFSKEQQDGYGTHSARIGGATRLFQLGASPEALKRMGGWSSDAYKVYIRLQQHQLMHYTREMCSEA